MNICMDQLLHWKGCRVLSITSSPNVIRTKFAQSISSHNFWTSSTKAKNIIQSPRAYRTACKQAVHFAFKQMCTAIGANKRLLTKNIRVAGNASAGYRVSTKGILLCEVSPDYFVTSVSPYFLAKCDDSATCIPTNTFHHAASVFTSCKILGHPFKVRLIKALKWVSLDVPFPNTFVFNYSESCLVHFAIALRKAGFRCTVHKVPQPFEHAVDRFKQLDSSFLEQEFEANATPITTSINLRNTQRNLQTSLQVWIDALDDIPSLEQAQRNLNKLVLQMKRYEQAIARCEQLDVEDNLGSIF